VEEKVEKMDDEFEVRVASSVRSVVREEVHEARVTLSHVITCALNDFTPM
jgi:hypothetical protein